VQQYIVPVTLAVLLSGCGSSSPTAPAASSPTPPSSPAPSAPPMAEAVSPATGSAAGSTFVIVSGTGFQVGTSVMVDGVRTAAFFFEGAMHWTTPPHPAGAVDVVVINPDGRRSTLAGGYTYAAAESFDFEGEWEGGTGADWATPVRFTISKGFLVRLSCLTDTNRVSSETPVAGGSFALVESGTTLATGRITSEGQAVGRVNLGPCGSDSWVAIKRP
jgi:IPT/TIG domain